MDGNYIGNNPNGTDFILSDNYQTNNPKLMASTACVYNAVHDVNNPIATGSTEARTLADRFGDIVNVKDFGAKGDGVTDDTAAIQAALDSFQDGELFFPSGRYVISDTITVTGRKWGIKNINLCGSNIVWNGPADGLMIHLATRGYVKNGVLRGNDSEHNKATAGTALKITWYWAGASDLLIERFTISGIDCGDDEHKGSLCAQLHNIEISSDIPVLSGEGGATGIRLIAYDNKLSNVSVLKCRHGIEIRTAGNNIVNYHCWASLPDGTPAMTTDCSAIYINAVSANSTGSNNFTNCYFDFVKYVIYNSITSKINVNITNSFYWAFPKAKDDGSCYDAYMMSPNACGLTVDNFTDSSASNVNFYSAIVSTKFSTTNTSRIQESYAINKSNKNSNASFLNTCFQVSSGKNVLVASKKDFSAGEYYFIGGVFSPSTDNNYLGDFTVKLQDRAYYQMEVKVISLVNRQYSFTPSSELAGWLGIAFGEPVDVTVNGHTGLFLPIYCHSSKATSNTQLFAQIICNGGNGGALFLKNEANSISFESSTYIFDAPSTVAESNQVHYYDETGNYAVVDFNNLTKAGTWQVSWDANTTNSPTTKGYGILEVMVMQPHSGWSSYTCVIQRLTVATDGATTCRTFLRKQTSGANGGTWTYAWRELSIS